MDILLAVFDAAILAALSILPGLADRTRAGTISSTSIGLHGFGNS